MESISLVERLRKAIEDDFKGVREELDKVKGERAELADKNDNIRKLNKDLKQDNLSLTKTLKELEEKYDHLHAKLKRKQDEIKKKDKWWDKYRFTAETMIKKLRTQGSFSPELLHEVSRDLVDIMEEVSSKESGSSQESEVKKPSKLTISKEGKKKFRYTAVSSENAATNSGTIQSREFKVEANCEPKCTGRENEGVKKHQNDDISPEHVARTTSQRTGPTEIHFKTGDKLKITATKTREDKNIDDAPTTSRMFKQEEMNNAVGVKSKFAKTEAVQKCYEANVDCHDQDETHAFSIGYPSLTSTPVFTSSNKKPLLSDLVLSDLSIIQNDRTNLQNNAVDIETIKVPETESIDPLTPAVPTIFENLLSKKTSADECPLTTEKSDEGTKGKSSEAMLKQNLISKSKTKSDTHGPQTEKDRKRSYNKNLRIVIPDISKVRQIDKSIETSQSILRNIESRGEAYDSTIDYPVLSEDNPCSPSILATELPVGGSGEAGMLPEGDCVNLKRLPSTTSLNGTKRKRGNYEERGMRIPQDDKEERQKPPDKKSYKMATKTHLSTKVIKAIKQVCSPKYSSVVLLSDEEDENKMETSSVDMFADSGRALSKDLSNDKDVIDIIDNESDPSKKTANPFSSQLSNDKVLNKEENESKCLDVEFPGFRKPEELNYKNIKVVRKKDERAKLNGFSCRDCEAYYGEMTETQLKKRLKHCSRHRAKYSPPPSTPPGFWNLSFPNTQEYIDGGMLVTGDNVPPPKPRRPRKRRLLKPVQK